MKNDKIEVTEDPGGLSLIKFIRLMVLDEGLELTIKTNSNNEIVVYEVNKKKRHIYNIC